MLRRGSRAIFAVAAGVLIASGLTVVALNVGTAECVPGPVVSSVNATLAPLLLLNAPYDGSANGTVPIENGTHALTLFANNSGGVWGYFERMDWTIRQGTGLGRFAAYCDSIFFPTLTNDWSSDVIPLFNASGTAYINDSSEAHTVQISGTPGPVYFSNGFSAPTGVVSTCGRGAVQENASSSYIQISVDFQEQGVSHVASLTLDVATNYQYFFPPNQGTWSVDNLSAPHGPGGGWAFSYSPCA